MFRSLCRDERAARAAERLFYRWYLERYCVQNLREFKGSTEENIIRVWGFQRRRVRRTNGQGVASCVRVCERESVRLCVRVRGVSGSGGSESEGSE